ncbi:hypothetical protein EKI60_02195 [Candidatus Saccharibacteria bacterium]|nr:MAG: hypothetical protein EKI60_02195 [Candidatus Saccharibacteria bacterium]
MLIGEYMEAGKGLGDVMPDPAHIDPTAHFDQSAAIGNVLHVGGDVVVGPNARVYRGAYLGDGVVIEDSADVFWGAVLLDGVRLGKHANVHEKTIVGPGVIVPEDTELGWDMVIPSNDTFSALGNMGLRQRTMAIYGSDTGPLLSLSGAMFTNRTLADLVENLDTKFDTTDESVALYRPRLSEVEEVGQKVQEAYDRNRDLVEELRQQVALLTGSQE